MKILSFTDFVLAAGTRGLEHRDFSLYDGAPYDCACGAIHKFYQHNAQHYLSTGTKAKFMVQCLDNNNVVTLLETRNKFVIFFDRFVSLAGNTQQLHTEDQKFRDTVTILNKLYTLTFNSAKYTSEIEKLVKEMGGKFNEHEIAIIFLASYSSHIKLDHPQAEIEVRKYISRAKGAYDRGLAHDPMPKEYLFSVASERFGIDPGAIEAF